MRIVNSARDYYSHKQQGHDMVEIKTDNGARIPAPCMHPLLVAREMVVANTYNPNHVPTDKMKLLQQSIMDNGFCLPITTIWNDDIEKFVIVDGFHRNMMTFKKWLGMQYIPVVVLPHDMAKRMVATMQFNKARGLHQVDLDAELIRKLIEQGMDDENVAVHLGIDIDTVYRYKQVTGVAEIFKNADYSSSWEMVDEEE